MSSWPGPVKTKGPVIKKDSKKRAEKTTLQRLTAPRKGEKVLDKAELDKMIESPDFYTRAMTPEGNFFFYFHHTGDFVTGRLLSKRSNADIYRAVSYRMELWELHYEGKDVPVKAGEIVEFCGNRQLHRTIDRNHLMGDVVRVEFIGRQRTKYSHARKVYAVYLDESRQAEPKPQKPRPGPSAKAGRQRGRERRARAINKAKE